MNKNPWSNQEIHALFEHRFKLENTENKLGVIYMTFMKALRTILVDIISPIYMLLLMQMLCTVMALRQCYEFESLQPMPFL